MGKIVEVLFRMQGVDIPSELPIEAIDRDDATLKRQREQGQVLRGRKVFQTNCEIHRGWMLNEVMARLKQLGFGQPQVNVEVRADHSGSVMRTKKVLSIGFDRGLDHPTDPLVLAWIEQDVMQKIFRLGMAHLNPMPNGHDQLVYDLSGLTSPRDYQAVLPLDSLLPPSERGQTAAGNSSAAEASLG